MDRLSIRLEDFLPYLLSRATQEVSARFARTYKTRYGFRRSDWRVLLQLGTTGDIAARDIARTTGEHKTQISRAVGRLEARGLLTRCRDEGDRRTENLALTESGREVFQNLLAEAAAHDAELARTLGADAVSQLKQALRSLMRG